MTDGEEKNYLDTLSDDLSRKLGRAVWSFARIEWLTYRYVKALSEDDLPALLNDFLSLTDSNGFTARTKILKILIRRSGADSQTIEAAVKLVNKAATLAERRNIIVHNPWQIGIDLDKKEFVSEIWQHTKPEPRLSEDDIVAFAADAQKVETDLEASLSALTNAFRATRSK